MPDVSYQLTARSNLAQVLTADAQAMKGLASASDTTYRQLTQGMNAATRAAAEMRKEIAAGATQAKTSATAHDSLFKSIAGGVAVGALAASALQAAAGAVVGLGTSALTTAANFEQSRIAFTTFLGSAGAMKTFLSDLQAFANVSPFTFTALQDDAKFLLAMGTAGKDVLPVLKDVSAAVSAAGGGEDALQRVSQAYAKINAEGKTSAIYLNELTRDGVPAWNMLAEATGKTVAQVRDMAAAGEITSAVFDQAFHAYTVEHYNGLLQQQSRTWAGLASTIADVGGQVARALGGPVLAAIEPELAKLTDDLTRPEVGATLALWGTNLGKAAYAATQLWDNVTAGARAAFQTVKPLFDTIGALLGGLPNAPTVPDPVAPVKATTGAMADLAAQTDATTAKAADYKAQIQGAQDVLEGMKRTDADRDFALQGSIDAEKRKLSVLEAQWAGADRATSVSRLQAKIAQDEALAKNLYSSVGASARDRLVGERQQLEDLQTAQAREGTKARMNATVQGLEDAKKAEDHAASLRERDQSDVVQAWQRRAQLEKDQAEQRKAQYDADLAAQAAAEAKKQTALQATYDKAKSLYALFSFATAPFVKTTDVQAGGLDKVKGVMGDLFTLSGDLAGRWKGDLADSFTAVKNILGDVFTVGNSVAGLFGEKGGLGGLMVDQWKLNLQIMTAAADTFTQSLRTINIGSALLSDLAKGGNDFKNTQGAYNEWAKHDAFTQAGQAVGGALDKALGTTHAPGGALARTGRDLPVVGAGDIQDRGADNPGGAGRVYPLGGGRASGGTVRGNTAYVVGEGGAPELFIPGGSGQIVPMGAGGGGGNLGTITVQHLCPACLQTEMVATILRSGQEVATAAGRYTRGSRHQ